MINRNVRTARRARTCISTTRVLARMVGKGRIATWTPMIATRHCASCTAPCRATASMVSTASRAPLRSRTSSTATRIHAPEARRAPTWEFRTRAPGLLVQTLVQVQALVRVQSRVQVQARVQGQVDSPRVILRVAHFRSRKIARSATLLLLLQMDEEGWRAAGVPRHTSVCSCQPHGHVDLPVRGGSSTTHHRSSVHRPITLACTHYTRRAPSPLVIGSPSNDEVNLKTHFGEPYST